MLNHLAPSNRHLSQRAFLENITFRDLETILEDERNAPANSIHKQNKARLEKTNGPLIFQETIEQLRLRIQNNLPLDEPTQLNVPADIRPEAIGITAINRVYDTYGLGEGTTAV